MQNLSVAADGRVLVDDDRRRDDEAWRKLFGLAASDEHGTVLARSPSRSRGRRPQHARARRDLGRAHLAFFEQPESGGSQAAAGSVYQGHPFNNGPVQ